MPCSLNTNQPSDSQRECDYRERERERLNESSDLFSKSGAKLLWDQLNVASVQREPLTRGWQTPAAPEGQTGSPSGSVS